MNCFRLSIGSFPSVCEKLHGIMVETNLNSVYESLFPFSYLNLFFCLTRVTKVGSTYRYHPWAIFFGIVNLLILPASLTLYYFTYQRYSLEESGVYFWSFRLFNFAILLRLTCIYILRLFTHKKEVRLYTAIDEFDKQMIALGKNKEITEANKNLQRWNMIAIPIAIVTYILGEIYINAISNTGIAWFIIISRFTGSFVGVLAKCQFYLWCTAIKDRFIMVNDLMRKVKEKFQLNNMFVVSVYKYEQCIEKYGDLHRDLTHMARQVNGIYQFDLLWHFTLMFMVIFTNAYYTAYTMLREKEDAKPVAMICNLIFIFIEIVLNIFSSTTLCNEVNILKIIWLPI